MLKAVFAILDTVTDQHRIEGNKRIAQTKQNPVENSLALAISLKVTAQKKGRDTDRDKVKAKNPH
jgi:hypothetical protein